jgi:transcriptional regulator with XRE-family HTH domain
VRTRIRHFRKQRGLTQSELAAALGTTAATVSRLETADMTVSTGWLERLAGVLGVEVADLVGGSERTGLVCLAELGRGGAVRALAEGIPLSPSLAAPAREPLAFRVAEEMGDYAAGDMLIADKVPAGEALPLLGRDCIVADRQGGRVFGRLVSAAGGHCLVVPPEAGAAAREIAAADWIAPVVSLVRTFAPVSRPRSGN